MNKLLQSSFGRIKDEPVSLFSLSNDDGMVVQLTDWGASICSIQVPDRQGQVDDVVLGYDSAEAYQDNPFYFGATVGRTCGRIGNARFRLNSTEFSLPANDGGRHHLHGGSPGFSHRLWQSQCEGSSVVRMTLFSPDGEQGYPGNLHVSAAFELMDGNALRITYKAQCDQDTIVNLTNHAYFNLHGAGKGDVRQHLLAIKAESFLSVDRDWIPTGEILPVEGTEMDFRSAKPVGDPIYNHYFLLPEAGGLKSAACLEDPASGRTLEVYTDQPGVQLYTGYFVDEASGRGGKHYGPCSGLSLETQGPPDAPNQPQFPSITLLAGESFQTTTIYRFGMNP